MQALIQQIETHYSLTVKNYKVIRDTDKSLVIRLDTSRGKWIGKCLYVSPERQEFILDAEEYLRKRGILIPSTLPTVQKERYFWWKEYPFVLQRRHDLPVITFNTPERLQLTGRTLGRIHARSIGFSSRHGHLFNGALKWEKDYQDKLAFLSKWQPCLSDSFSGKIAAICNALPFFQTAAATTAKLLLTSPSFAKWIKTPPEQQFLCHGDFNNGNLLMRKKGLIVIDWEDVRYDFPSKDLSRVLYLLMRKQNRWNKSAFLRVLHAYLKENPLSASHQLILYADLAFPHIVERFLRKQEYLRMTHAQVLSFLQRERKKIAYFLQEAKACCQADFR